MQKQYKLGNTVFFTFFFNFVKYTTETREYSTGKSCFVKLSAKYCKIQPHCKEEDAVLSLSDNEKHENFMMYLILCCVAVCPLSHFSFTPHIVLYLTCSKSKNVDSRATLGSRPAQPSGSRAGLPMVRIPSGMLQYTQFTKH